MASELVHEEVAESIVMKAARLDFLPDALT
jgi:hypothetical protein